jgi:tRNA1(Val) A37 N6-methylase TrmN6
MKIPARARVRGLGRDDAGFDFVLDGRVRLRHSETGGFRTAMDAVFLAAGCKARAGDTVLDLGCGVGAAGLCVMARVPGARLTGVDIQPELINLARANAALNDMQDRTEFFVGDVRDMNSPSAQAEGPVLFVSQGPPGQARGPDMSFDHVICNPPYLAAGTYTPSPDASRGLALGHAGQDTTLADWVHAAHRLVKSRGTFTIIHRADHLDQIISAAGRRFGAVEIIPLWPRAGADAKRVIVRMIKDRRDPPVLRAGVALHEQDGSWTIPADQILRQMASLDE